MSNNSVYVLTEAKPFKVEKFVDIFASPKAIERYLKIISPFVKKDGDDFIINNNGDITLYFVRKTTVKE